MNHTNEIMEKIIPIVEEMGENRFRQYMKAYLEVNGDKNLFFEQFANYIDSCKEGKNGFKRISIYSFKNFVVGIPSLEELQKIWDNAEDQIHD